MNTTIEKLTKFVNQRPGLDFCNYGDVAAYRSESREITADRNDYFELLAYANILSDNLDADILKYLSENSGRLTIDNNGNLQYCTGQYFPTEYRPAANRVLVSIIWDKLRKTYDNGNDIRKAAKRNLSRRVIKNYFN